MITQDGTLVVLVKDFHSTATLDAGVYFAIKIGNKSIRFNKVRGEMVFRLIKDDTTAPLEMFIFQRRARSKRSSIGRRRDLIDQCAEHYYKKPASKLNDYFLEWKSIEIRFCKIPLYFVMDLEFYPSVPLIPFKGNIDDTADEAKNLPSNLQLDNKQNNKALPESSPAVCNVEKKAKLQKSGKSRKRDKIKSAIARFQKDDLTKDKFTANLEEDTIYYDLKSTQGLDAACQNYEHGKPLPHEVLMPIETGEVYSFIKSNQRRKTSHDTLPLDVSPQTFFKEARNRVIYNEKMNFLNMFSSNNIKLTGYLGNGQWRKRHFSNTLLNWYLQPGIQSLPGPPLPPKCPQGMLWEEYYLLNHELYSKDVLR